MNDQEGHLILICLIHKRKCFPSDDCDDDDYEQNTMKVWPVTTPVPKLTLKTHFH